MKFAVLLVVCLSVGVCLPVAQELPRVRPLDSVAADALARGQHRSARFRALVAELAASDLIVHVVTSHGLQAGLVGTTRLVAGIGEARYVRIDLAASLPWPLRVATLGHELQHACELARSTASTSGAVRALYEQIGRGSITAGGAFETADAEQAGREVWLELARRPIRRAGRLLVP
jgi:hypothetical protein